MYRRRKTVDLSSEEIKFFKCSHIIVRIPPGKNRKYVNVQIDMHSRSSRILNFDEKTSLLGSFFLPRKSINKNLGRGDIRHYVKLSGIKDAVSAELKILKCIDITQSLCGIAQLIEPWNIGASQLLFLTCGK